MERARTARERLVDIAERLVRTSGRFASGRLLVVSTATFLVFLAVVLPGEAARSATYFGDNPTPDGSFIYSAEDLYGMASAYGEEGRRYYIRSRFTFDVVWPLAYGLFLWSGIAYFGREVADGRYAFAALLAPLAVAFDFAENTSASIVMWQYPEWIPVIPHLAPAFTFLKWITIGTSFVVFGLLALGWLGGQVVRWRRGSDAE